MKAASLGIAILLCRLIKGEPLDQFVRHFELADVVPEIITSTDDSLTAEASFKAYGREFSVHVVTHQALFEPNFHVEVVEQNARKVKRDFDTRRFVTGYVLGEVGSNVHGRIVGNTLNIVIHSQRETYHVEHASKYGIKGDFNSVVYRASDIKYDLELKPCTSTDYPRLRLAQESSSSLGTGSLVSDLLKRRKRAIDPDRNTCTLRIVADYEFFREIGGSLESTTLEVMMDHIQAADSIYRVTEFDGVNGIYTGFGVSIASAQIYKDEGPTNPVSGDFSPEELLEAFASSNFDDVCLGHLFTYRDFQGVIGLAYLADPNGQLAGGICQRRSRTNIGELNLNTGFTSLLNFGNTIPRSVSYITTAHELGHNHGSPHDSPDDPACTPEGNLPKYIMFPSATNGGLKEFSPCSRDSIGRTLEARSDQCFITRPSGGECGDGVIQPGEECDCGSMNETVCTDNDPCCTVNCTLAAGANCSALASSCCDGATCQPRPGGVICRTGDREIDGCQDNSICNGLSAECPASTPSPNGTSCNNGMNVCEDGSCIGSPCPLFNDSQPCYCTKEEELCDVCCLFDGEDGECISTFNRDGVNDTLLLAGSPCGNFSGYCTRERMCLRINNNDPLDNLRGILLEGFTSIAAWLETNWYWILVGFAGLVILMILVQVTYRRKKIKTTEETDSAAVRPEQSHGTQGRQGQGQTYGYFQTASRPFDEEAETSTLIANNRV